MAEDVSYRLLMSLSKSISHQLRTPLSVIRNEVALLRDAIPSDDFERLERKCREMIRILDSLNLWSGTGQGTKTVDLAPLLQGVFENSPQGYSLHVFGETREWEQVVQSLAKFFGEWGCKSFERRNSTCTFYLPTFPTTSTESYLLTEAVEGTGLTPSVSLAFLDAFFRRMGVKTAVRSAKPGALAVLNFSDAAP
jgi:hypothetical protein